MRQFQGFLQEQEKGNKVPIWGRLSRYVHTDGRAMWVGEEALEELRAAGEQVPPSLPPMWQEMRSSVHAWCQHPLEFPPVKP